MPNVASYIDDFKEFELNCGAVFFKDLVTQFLNSYSQREVKIEYNYLLFSYLIS